MTIKVGIFGIEVALDDSGTGGSITSELRDDKNDNESDESYWLYSAAIDGIESFILAQACAGIDITTPAYQESIRTAVDAVSNNY